MKKPLLPIVSVFLLGLVCIPTILFLDLGPKFDPPNVTKTPEPRIENPQRKPPTPPPNESVPTAKESTAPRAQAVIAPALEPPVSESSPTQPDAPPSVNDPKDTRELDIQKARKRLREQMALKQKFADILSLFKLTGDEREDLLAVLAQGEIIDPTPDGGARRRDNSKQLRDLLGEDGYKILQDHKAAERDRMHLKSYEKTLGDKLALSRTQRTALQALFAQLRTFHQTQVRAMGLGGKEPRLDELSERYSALAQQAQGFLEQEQSDLLADHLKQHLNYMEMEETMMELLREKTPANRMVVFIPAPTLFDGSHLTASSITYDPEADIYTDKLEQWKKME